jgi:hypothetical protein
MASVTQQLQPHSRQADPCHARGAGGPHPAQKVIQQLHPHSRQADPCPARDAAGPHPAQKGGNAVDTAKNAGSDAHTASAQAAGLENARRHHGLTATAGTPHGTLPQLKPYRKRCARPASGSSPLRQPRTLSLDTRVWAPDWCVQRPSAPGGQSTLRPLLLQSFSWRSVRQNTQHQQHI